jgi:hypothetical protein
MPWPRLKRNVATSTPSGTPKARDAGRAAGASFITGESRPSTVLNVETATPAARARPGRGSYSLHYVLKLLLEGLEFQDTVLH